MKGQDRVVRYPVRFSQYYNCYPLLNPSTAGSYSKLELSLGNQRMLGNFSKIFTYYFNANMRILDRGGLNKPYSTIGVMLYNDREGKYLNLTRFYAIYVWHGNLSERVKFSGGFQIGGMNYNVKGTPLSGDGSDLKPDAAVGVQVYNPSFHAGISVNQVFNSELQPLEEITVLAPYINITADRKWDFSNLFRFVPCFAMHLPLTSQDGIKKKVLIDANLNFTFRERFFVSTGIHNNDILNISAGINDVLSSDGILNIHLTYAFSVFQSAEINTNSLEIGLGYFF
ncbi:hypothetical protein ES703_94743 [subsurface metagenome]